MTTTNTTITTNLASVLTEEEYYCQYSNKTCDTQVDPLDGLKRTTIFTNVLEDDLSSKDRSNNRANSLNGLRKLKTKFRPLGRTADGNVWVGRDLKSRQTGSSKEHGTTEATEASLDSCGPEHERTDAVDGQTEDESVAVTKSAEEPSRVCQRADEVGAEVGGLQTR